MSKIEERVAALEEATARLIVTVEVDPEPPVNPVPPVLTEGELLQQAHENMPRIIPPPPP